MSIRELLKSIARGCATLLVVPALCSFRLRSVILGPDRALEGSTQALALIPGIAGQYVRRAFLARTLARCASSVVVEFGTIFSATGARLDEYAYIGPHCHIGLVHLGRDVLVGPRVDIPSGRLTHGITDAAVPIREQAGDRVMVHIGRGAWIGSAAVVMADVGAAAVIGAGAVVTRPIPDAVIAGGVPARVLRTRYDSVDRHAALAR